MTTTKIYGAPGTGKTTRMLDLLQREIEGGTPLERIAFVTHTVAAKVEAKERIQRVLTLSNEKEQLKYFRTIHGICYGENDLKRDNVMQSEDYLKFGEYIGVPFSSNFTDDVDMDGLPVGYSLSGGNEILAVRQFAAAQCLSVSELPEEWPNWASPKLMRQVITKFKTWKDQHAKFDFVDMLQLYIDHGEPLDIDVLFIDEAQDLSKLQWQIVNKMMKRAKRVYIAGDDDQSIYGFIGADRFGFLDYKADKTEILPITYRLKTNIWNHAQKIIEQVSRRQYKPIEVRGEGGVIDFYNNDLLYLGIEHESTMIIARHHFHLQRLAQSLEVRGIPYKGRGREVHGTDQACATVAYFRAREGQPLGLRDASRMLRFIGNKEGVKKLNREARDNPGRTIEKEALSREFNVNWEANWRHYLSRNRTELGRAEIIGNILNYGGVEALENEPKVSLTTYHGCKGREADHVICLTDCFRKAYDGASRHPDDELRLSYVGVTRARERLTIVPPTTELWMRSMI